MEILGTISTVDSLCGTVISLVKKLYDEVKRARSDVATLPGEIENLQTQYEKLRDRVTQVKDIYVNLAEVRKNNPKLGEAENEEREVKKLLKKLEKSLESDKRQIESFKSAQPERRSIFKAFIRKGAFEVQKQIRKILKRLEDDCRDLDQGLNVGNVAGGVRREAGIDRVEIGVGVVAAAVDQVKELLTERVPMIPDPQSSGPAAQVLPEYSVALVERARVLEEKVKSLKDKEAVRIWGMGGIGKTTLAKQVFNNISGDFDYTCFVNDVKSIQPRELDKEILKKFQKIGGTSNLRSWADLTNKKILIIMDDIDRDEQLTSVHPRRPEFGKGSVVMFTTRNSHLCKRSDIVSFEVPFLSTDDARRLFCQHAFNQEDIPVQAQTSKYVEEVVKKCCGLPLSLEVIGRHLNGEDADMWEGTLLKLSSARGIDGARKDSIFETLKISYDALEEEEQQMFLDIATFFVGRSLDVALAAMSTSRINSRSCWTNLVRRCLVKEEMQTDSDDVGLGSHVKRVYESGRLLFESPHVWMHEHLKDLGKNLARNSFLVGRNQAAAEKVVEEINSYKVVTLLSLFHQGPGETKHLRSVSCSYPYSYPPPDKTVLQMSSFAKVTGLKYLRLYNCHHQDLFQELPRDLALLQWRTEDGHDLSNRLHDMKNLTVLQLEAVSNKSNAESCVQPPDSFEGFTKLKILLLKESYPGRCRMKLKDLPQSFGELLSLEILILRGVDVTHLPESFGNLSSIRSLHFSGCHKLTHLPESFGKLSSLRSLTIENCSKLTRLPPSFSNLSGLCILSCPNTKLVEFEDAFQNLSMFQNLQVLQLHLLNANMPPSFSQLSGCKTLQYVRLTLTHKDSDTDVCWDLSPLERLTLQGKELTALSHEFGRRVSGDQVNLRFELDKGSAGSSQRILAMTAIEISREKGVPSLLQGPGPLGLPQVQTFPKSFGKLLSIEERIEELKMCEDDLIEEADSSAGLSSFNLRVLRVRFSSQLKTPPKSVGQFGSLKELKISGCSNLKTLPESLEQLGSVQKLRITDCGELLTLPESMGNLAFLTQVRILRCSKLKAVPQNWGKVTSSPGQASASSCSLLRRQKLYLWVAHCPSLVDFVRNLEWDFIEEVVPGLHRFTRKKVV